MKTLRARPCLRHGASVVSLIAILIGVVALIGLGYGLGRMTAPQPIVAPPPPAVAAMRPDGAPNTIVTATPPKRPVLAVPPPVVFEPASLDFGSVMPDVEMKGVVQIRNTGREPLTILAMRPDCKCTTLEDLAGTTIEPGETVPLTVVMEARDSVGSKASEVRILFDGYSEIASLHINSRVTRAVASDPAYFEASREMNGVITVFSADGRPFRILAVDRREPPYADDFNPAIDEPRTEYVLAWDIRGYDPETCQDAAGRTMPDWWVIETDHPLAPIVDVHVRHVPCTVPESRGERPWVLSALHRVLDPMEPGGTAEFAVTLKWLTKDNEPSDTIRTVVSESPEFEARLLGVEREDKTITARVEIVPRSGHLGLVFGTVRFFSYHPGHSQPITVIGRVVETSDATKVSSR